MNARRDNDVAVVGLGVMGANLARNLARRGFAVAVHNRSPEVTAELCAAHPEAGFDAAPSLKELVAKLARPRRIVLMVPAGAPVDAVLDGLDPFLERDDVVVDAGNSHFRDTDRREERARSRPWRFVGMGVSGGAEGALLGPSIMPGGDWQAWELLHPLLVAIAATGEHGPCVAYCGRGSAGHFVKMVHNGIEYGDMQLIAEVALLLRRGLGLGGAAVADVFAEWNRGELDSFLVAITADIFRARDPRGEGLLVDAILDSAQQKGTGRWTVASALELGVVVPTLAAAVDARALSAQKALRERAEPRFERPSAELGDLTPADLEAALYAAKIASYTQGFALLRAADRAYGYGTDLAEMARIWTAGCIIRARFLGDVASAFRADPELESLVLAPAFVARLGQRLPAWRRVVAAAARAGLPVPGLATSLAWFDTLTTARGSAALIQAQRDYFGSHTYERADEPGVAQHTEWPRSQG